MHNGCPFFLSVILLMSAVQAEAADTVKQAPGIDLSRLKFATPQLSVRLIEQHQQKLEPGSETWLSWEKKHLQLLSELGNWSQIIERINTRQLTIPEDYRAWFALLKATAQLKLSRAGKVRGDIRRLIWSDTDLTTEQIASARRLIIRSYLIENKAADAQRAMLRYQQDYGEGGLPWRLLQTKVLLATQRFQQAARLMAKEKEDSVQPLKQLTRLKAGLDGAQYSYKKALQSALQTEAVSSQNIKRQNWMLAYIAAGLERHYKAEIEALEYALITGVADADHDLIAVSAALLWQKYLQYAEYLGNQNHLLTGDDEAWFAHASDRFETQPTEARALLAYVGIKASVPARRQLAFTQLSVLIDKKITSGIRLIELLFSDPGLFDSVQKVPIEIRYQLLDYALSRGKIKRAARLFEFLPQPPEGKKRLAWDMRRARVLVLGGEYKQGAEVLLALLKHETLSVESLNRLMQVIFDLQKVEQHGLAIELFDAIDSRSQDPELQRELRFWSAESYQALQQYEVSAHLYLTSALMIAEKQSDPWSQTARYKAAEVLTMAGLIDDARSLLQQLLKSTSNSNRKAIIKQKLQELWLLEGKPVSDGG